MGSREERKHRNWTTKPHAMPHVTDNMASSRAKFLRQVILHHPDKGGSTESFVSLMNCRFLIEQEAPVPTQQPLPKPQASPLAWDYSSLIDHAQEAMAKGRFDEARKIFEFAELSDHDCSDGLV